MLLIRKVLIYSLTIEGIAAVIFAIRWSFDMPVGRAVYYGIWHAVSLFNNAGFDLFGEYRSLTGYAEDFVVNSVAMADRSWRHRICGHGGSSGIQAV